MNRAQKRGVVIGVVALLGALAFVAVASAKDKPESDPDDGPCGPDGMINPMRMLAQSRLLSQGLSARELERQLSIYPICVARKCPPGFHRNPMTGACVKNTPEDPGPGFDPWDTDDDCPEGMILNAARLKPLAAGLKGAELEAELAKYPACVPRECPPGMVRNEYGDCEYPDAPANDDRDCPDGQEWDPRTRSCRESCPPGQRWSAALRRCVDVADDPIDFDDIIKDFPEGNSFYQVKQGDIIGYGLSGMHWEAVTQNMLGRELFLAARDHLGMNNEDALAWSKERRKNQSLTNKIYNAIQCGAFNDYAYGTYGYCGDVAIQKGRCPKSMRNMPGEHGRAVRPLPQHADNQMRLRSGLNAARVVAILTPAAKGNGLGNAVMAAVPGGKSSFPLLWLPGVDRKRLAESDGKDLVFIEDQANPPAQFFEDRGNIQDFSGSTLTSYGCGYGQRDLL